MERGVDPAVGKHVVGVMDSLFLELIAFALFPEVFGFAVSIYPGHIEDSQALKPPQRAQAVPFACHWMNHSSFFTTVMKTGYRGVFDCLEFFTK
jgi:hypothetical protein